MLIADWIAIGVFAFFCLIGLLVGFGRGLRFFTGGIIGVLIAVLVCYSFGGIIYKLNFVQSLLNKLVAALSGKNEFCDILLKIRFDIITYYVVLFIIVLIIRLIIVKIISGIAEVNNVFLRFINKILGIVLFAAALALIVLLAFMIISLIGGSTEANFLSHITGSKLYLDKIYENNPLMQIIMVIKIPIVVGG